MCRRIRYKAPAWSHPRSLCAAAMTIGLASCLQGVMAFSSGPYMTLPFRPREPLPNFRQLQNEFDVRGVSIKSDKQPEVTFCPQEAFYVAAAFSSWLTSSSTGSLDGKEPRPKFVVGCDSRLTSQALSRAVFEGFESTSKGSAQELSLCSTPSVFHACQKEGLSAVGGIMVTASHLPYDRNGMKFFTCDGGLTSSQLYEVLGLASTLFERDQEGGKLYGGMTREPAAVIPNFCPSSTKYVLDVYGAHLVHLLRSGVNAPSAGADGGGRKPTWERPLQGLKILVNAGNGAGGFFTRVLQQCGADTRGSLYLNPDGRFPNHPPNPENREAMQRTQKAVREAQAHLGVVFDTDVDRVGFVQGGGRPRVLNRNRLIALASAVVLRDHPGSCIVTDSVSSLGVERFIRERGGQHVRYMKGYKNVIDKALELQGQGHDCGLAIECSGHAAFRENRFSDDGCFLAVKLIVELARGGPRGLDALFEDLQEPAESVEIRLIVREGQERTAATKRVLVAFTQCVEKMGSAGWAMEETNYEGLRATVQEGEGKRGWMHFRASLHDPVVSLTLESDTVGGSRLMLRSLIDNMMSSTGDVVDWQSVIDHVAAVN